MEYPNILISLSFYNFLIHFKHFFLISMSFVEIYHFVASYHDKILSNYWTVISKTFGKNKIINKNILLT